MILITRPADGAQQLAALLEARGHLSFIEPLLHVSPIAATPPRAKALLITSRHSVSFLTHYDKAVPCFAVGEHTAQAIETLGFTAVQHAPTLETLLPALQGLESLLYLRGRDVAHDVLRILASSGTQVEEAIVYEAVAAEALSTALCLALSERRITVATFLSARTASVFATRAAQAGIAPTLRHVRAAAFSPAVAAALAALPWRDVAVCRAPTLSCLADEVDKLARAP